MKIGIEVEGRFKGLKSLFLTAEEYLDMTSHEIERRASANNVQQIQISDVTNRLDLTVLSLQMLADKYLLSIERTKVGPEYRGKIQVILWIDDESYLNLYPTDQIKFSKNRNVKLIAVENMFDTKPQDFNADVTI